MMSKPVESDNWVDMDDWLGNEDPKWSTRHIKELLKDLIDSGFIYQNDEAVIYSFLNRKGVLNLTNRHKDFFQNIIAASRTPSGKESIEKYVNGDSQTPPDLEPFKDSNIPKDEEGKVDDISIDKMQDAVDDSKLFDFDKYVSPETILKDSEVLESISEDNEAMDFYIAYKVNQLWKSAFVDEAKTINETEEQRKTGNKFRDTVTNKFLKDYYNTKKIKIPNGYNFKHPNTGELISPFLMQSYCTYKIKNDFNFGNFSGTGAGKTLSAILASRVIDSKLTLIVCPNDVVQHWSEQILEIFPDSKIITGNEVFGAKYDETSFQYLVLNYDKLNQANSPNLVLQLIKEKIDYVVLDEIHFTKIRGKSVGVRRENLDGLMSYARKKNPDIRVLGMSATPVINNLTEGKSLIELITGKSYSDVSTKPRVPNAVTLFEKFTTLSVRQRPDYPMPKKDNVEVYADRPSSENILVLNKNPLAMEQLLTEARIPEIIRRIKGQTIIYTEYVGSAIKDKKSVVTILSDAVRDAGFSFGLYTGDDHSGLTQFKEKKFQVLIASRPISTGVDGLQHVCSNLIFNTLPWTYALYQQIIGRIVRTGMNEKKTVHIHHILASIAGYPYDQIKMDRLKFKRTLADCAVDGILPEANLVTAAQATREALNWLKRLENGEISCVTRRDLDVQLTPVEVKSRLAKYGDFTKLNQNINVSNSSTNHKKFLKNPEIWHEYQRLYRVERPKWPVIPYEHWIKRIKKFPDSYLIGDFGCGEAKLHEKFGSRVKSFDHVSIGPHVQSCDMSDVSKFVKDGQMAIAVFSLSLMGKNWTDYIKEASRCLGENGLLFVSETTKSLDHRLSNLRNEIAKQGFEIYKDSEINPFTFIEARKIESE
jgi:superfamily II DNA or RNA helicase